MNGLLILNKAFTGEADAWRMHLRGAIEMFRSTMKEERSHARHTEEALAILRSSIPLEGEAADLCGNVSAIRFMSSAVLWLDIIGSITEGTEPRLLSMHGLDLGTESGIRLEEVMGCQNAVMTQIARVAALQATTIRTGSFSECDLEVADIREALCQAKQQATALMCETYEPQRKASEIIAKVTQFFSHAAGIYLHLTAIGFRDSYTLQQITADAMTFVRTQINTDFISGLVCPLFIMGCAVDSHNDQELFRRTFSSHQFLNPLFKHRTKLLPILEDVWNERWREGYSWSNVVQLSRDILLI